MIFKLYNIAKALELRKSLLKRKETKVMVT